MKGIDISNNQGYVNISAVKSAGYDFVISKATEGTSFVDSYFIQNCSNTKAQGMLAGAYHFARFQNTTQAVAEANFFKEHCSSNVDFVALDAEHSVSGDMTNACLAFLDIVSSIAPAFFYSYPDWIRQHLNSSITKYPLWIASPENQVPVVPIWSSYAIWQNTFKGSVPGVSGYCDVDVTGPAFNLNRNSNYITPNAQYDSSLVETYQKVANRYGFHSTDHNSLVENGVLDSATISSFPDIPYLGVDRSSGRNFNELYPELICVAQDCLCSKGLMKSSEINKVYDLNMGDKLTGFQKDTGLSTSGVIDTRCWVALMNENMIGAANSFDSYYVTLYQKVANRYGFHSIDHNPLEVNGLMDEATVSSFPTIPYLGGNFNDNYPEMIRVAQDCLMAKGYSLPQYGNDGRYGLEMGSALTGFQKDHNLSTSGAVDTKCWIELLRK